MTPRPAHCSRRHTRLGLAIAALIAAPFSLQVLAETTQAPASQTAADSQKSYALFMGNDLAIEYKNNFLPVREVLGTDVVVVVDGKTTAVKRHQVSNFRISPSLKMSHLTVTIDDLHVAPGYTPANDPGLAQLDQMKVAYAAQAAATNTASRQAKNVSSVHSAANKAMAEHSVNPTTSSGMTLANAQNALANMNSTPSGVGSVAGGLDPLNTKVQAIPDAIDVDFSISSPVPLDSAYAIVVIEYCKADDMKDQIHRFVHTVQLPAIGREAKKVSFKIDNLQPNFEYKRSEIHIYQNVRELATNLSEKRVPITRENAAAFVLVSYLGDHKKDTSGPKAILMPNVEGARARVSKSVLTETFFVRIDAKGKVLGVSSTPDESKAAPIEVAEAMKEFVFLPALDKGVAKEGVLKLRMADHL